MRTEYFIVLGLSLFGPLLVSFSRQLRFYRFPKRLLVAIAVPMPVFLAWDAWATARGHWNFNPDHVTGVMLGNLPLEEVLFFVVVPFCALLTWEVVKHYRARHDKDGAR
jgi:lycopene beta-cyclase